MTPVVRVRDATMRYGARVLFEHLDLDVAPGEFLAVLGPNGAGKSTLLEVLLGLTTLTSGTVEVDGRPPGRDNARVGYIPQQDVFDRDLPLRGRDLVQLGVDGHRRGLPFGRLKTRARVEAALASVDATGYADAPIGRLSGGEQQRLRIAQALVADPNLLLCDEPFLSLDLAHQQSVSALVNARRTDEQTAVIFVTHEINPILPFVDRVLYLVGGRSAIGSAAEIFTSERLSALYDTPIDVLDVRGRIVVVGGDDGFAEHGHHHHVQEH
jgi:zinc/manganese transport system ATP-binding protein